MAIRKGTKVRYIGNENKLMIGNVYTVNRKCGLQIKLYAPIKYLGGEIHKQKVCMYIEDFEEVAK